MKITEIKTARALVLLAAGLLTTIGAMAEKPEWAGGGKHGKPEQREQNGRSNQQAQREGEGRPERMQEGFQAESSQGNPGRIGRHFHDDQRTVVHNYYSEQYRIGRCPPGLAKKNNGCMPPGKARNWAVGRPLPRDVVYYNLPPSITVQLGVPPAGQRYVRVASDILLIAIGTGMVIDGIQDLGRL
jgi:Ni/Co efflux regulator RcnB